MELGTGQAQSWQGWGAAPVSHPLSVRMWWRGRSRADPSPEDVWEQRDALGSHQLPDLGQREHPVRSDRVSCGSMEMHPHEN